MCTCTDVSNDKIIAPPPAPTRRRPRRSRPPCNPAPSATERPRRIRPRVTAENICHYRAVPNFARFARSSTTTRMQPPPTQRSISGLYVEMTARRGARLSRGSIDVRNSVSERSSHEVHAISPEKGREHVDDIIVVLDYEQRPTGKFRKLGSLHGPAWDHSSGPA
jgi:hypothetical protein